MALNVYAPRDWKYGISEQATWGTAVLDSAAFHELNIESPELDRDITFMETKAAHGPRNPTNAEMVVRTSGAAPKLTLTGIAKEEDFDLILYTMIQNVTEGGAEIFSKEFTFNQTSQPDFTTNAGSFLTFIAFDPVSAKSIKVKDLITQQLTITGSPGEYLKYSAAMTGRGLPTHASTPSGTWTVGANDVWHFADIATATYDGSNMNLCGDFEINLSQTVIPVGSESGEFQTFGLVDRVLTYKVTMMHGVATDTLQTAAEAQTNVNMRIGWGNAIPGTTDGDLDFDWNAIVKDIKTINADGDITSIEVSGDIVAATSANDPITITLANSIDRSW